MDTINNWKIISPTPFRKYGRYYIRVKCTCGSGIEKDLQKSHLSSMKSRGCEKCSRFHTSKGLGLISGEFWSMIRHGAQRRKISFEITMEQAWEKYLKQGKKCALSGLEIEFEPNCVHKPGKDNRRLRTASLDRIDSSQGYTIDNVQWVHKDINLMKNHFNEDYFLKICNLIVNKNEGSNKKVTS